MKMEVRILSAEMIKPSTPTPQHLREFKMSLLDQLAPPSYIPVILFYTMNHSHHHHDIGEISTQLKKSLSETLTCFYPLAGRIKDSFSVDCNDEGVLFKEARVNCRLSEFLEKPDIGFLNKFLPCNTGCKEEDPAAIVAFQVNTFECGGVVIGSGMFHKIVDGVTMSVLLNSWAKTVRGCSENLVHPDLASASSLFPQRDSLSSELSFLDKFYFEEGEFITRRFVFDAEAIATLKAKAASESIPNPTRVEALTCFIWKRLIAASESLTGTSRISIVVHAVNLRQRTAPPLANYSLGNLVWLVDAIYNPSEKKLRLPDLVKILRETFANVKGDTIKRLQGDEGLAQICDKIKEMEEMYAEMKPDTCVFSSWCNFGLYEVDFGWGKPIWVGYMGDVIGLQSNDDIIFIDGGRDDGIEVWMISNVEGKMGILEKDPEFLAFASQNPSILNH